MTTPLPPTDPSSGDDKLPGEAELAALYRQLPENVPGAYRLFANLLSIGKETK